VTLLVLLLLLAQVPANPLTVSRVTATSVLLKWNWSPNGAPATTFEIERGPAVTGPFHKIATPALTARSYTDATPTARKNPYCYEVIALGSKGNSPPSNVACVTITAEKVSK
jgi:hypothetical protein